MRDRSPSQCVARREQHPRGRDESNDDDQHCGKHYSRPPVPTTAKAAARVATGDTMSERRLLHDLTVAARAHVEWLRETGVDALPAVAPPSAQAAAPVTAADEARLAAPLDRKPTASGT